MSEHTEVATNSLGSLLGRNPVVGAKKAGGRRFWTNREIEVVKQNYVTLGLAACVALLPGRSASSIYQRAGILKLLRPVTAAARKGFPAHRWTSTPHIDRTIERGYAQAINRGDIQKLADSVGRPRHWVSKRAEKLGYRAPRFKQPAWTQPELDLIEQNAWLSSEALCRMLRLRGFPNRSPIAVKVKLVRLGADRTDPYHYTATALGALMGLDPSTISNWAETGLLEAKRRGTDRKAVQGGDMWWIHRKAVRRFILEHTHKVDIRKVDKHWFVDLVAHGHKT